MAEKSEYSPVRKPTGIRWWRVTILVACIATLYLLGQVLVEVFVNQFNLHVRAHNEPLVHRAIMTAAVIYIVLMVIPFMPAAEIGLSMLLIFGGKSAFLVYVCTVTALTLAFLAGRFFPATLVSTAFSAVGLRKAQAFADRVALLDSNQRLDLLIRESPARLVPHLVRHRFLALAILLNLPGNVLIGGGGGIAMLAGMTRLFSFPAYLLTIALAVVPVPLIFYRGI